MEIDMPESELNLEKDPYLILGYGVNAYLYLLWELARMFMVVSVIAIPIFAIYSAGVGGKGGAFMEDDSYYLSKFTLGNIGGASVFCG